MLYIISRLETCWRFKQVPWTCRIPSNLLWYIWTSMWPKCRQ